MKKLLHVLGFAKLLLEIEDVAYDINDTEFQTKVKIYGVICHKEPVKITKSISQWVTNNVKLVKPRNMVVYPFQKIRYVAKAQYDEEGKWKGVRVTRIEIQ